MKSKSIYHWLVVAACSGLAMAAIGISINCAGIFFTPVSETLGVGRGDISMSLTLTNVVTGLAGPFVVSRLIGRVHIKLLTGAGAVITALCFAGLSMAQHIAVFYVLCALMGLVITGYGSVVITYIIGNWFEEKNGVAMGITLSCSGLGGAIFNPVLNAAIEAFGWRSAYLLTAGIILALSLPGILLVIRERPEERGLLPYGAARSAVQPAGSTSAKSSRVSFRNAAFVCTAIFAVLVYAVSGFNAHMPGLASSLGLSASVGALMVSASMVGNVLFKLLIGVLSDALGALKACAIMLFLDMLGMGILTFIPESGMVLPMLGAFLFGGIYAAAAVGIPLVVRYVYGPQKHSIMFSYISLLACISSSCTMAGFGYSYDLFQTYKIATIFCIVTSALAIALLLLVKRVRRTE